MYVPMHKNKTVEDSLPIEKRRRFLDWSRRIAVAQGAKGLHTNEQLAEFGMNVLRSSPRRCKTNVRHPAISKSRHDVLHHEYSVITHCTKATCPHI